MGRTALAYARDVFRGLLAGLFSSSLCSYFVV